MKLDMHCHVKEGSIDSKVSLDEYITLLKERGFDGMLITDHDTYKGYRHWKYQMKGKVHDDFVVLKGIEYDTCDGGHILCIMPEGVKMRLLELRGLPVAVLIDFVHKHGGILGPAHPCGGKYLSFTNTKRYYKSPELFKRFDFIEVFNACESAESNARALKLAQKYKKPGIGSKSSVIETGGSLYGKTTKDKMGKADKILTYSFWFYNKAGTIMRKRKRMLNGKIENPVDPIDPIELKYM